MTQLLEERVLETRIPQDSLYTNLRTYEAPYLEEKLLERVVFVSQEKYQEAFDEFKKYIYLVKINKDKPIAMVSKQVDEVWHQFILFTQEYHEFCRNIFGKYLHHIPKTKSKPLDKAGAKNFALLYKETFGSIPSIWGINQDCTSPGPECAPEGHCNSTCDRSE